MNFGSIIDLVKGAAQSLAPKDWHGVHKIDGQPDQTLTVQHIDCGANWASRQDWFATKFTGPDGKTHKLMGKTPLLQPGQRGGEDVILVDPGTDAEETLPNPDMVIGIKGGFFKVTVSLGYKTGDHERYEFTGTLSLF